MSGAFHFEAPNGAAPFGGMHAGIFQPPTSPSTTTTNSAYLQQSTASMYSDLATPVSHVKRKRPGMGDVYHQTNTAAGHTPGGEREMRYTLAGQIETPGGAAQRPMGDMEDSTYSDVDYRRALGSKRPREDPDAPPLPGASTALGWSRLALDTIGGVMGRVWEFCREGAFRGFYAGGGRGYAMQPPASTGQVWCNEHDVPTLPEIPGVFPESDYMPFYYERETPGSTPPPAAKRRQIVEDTPPRDELRKNWVMVEGPAHKRPPTHPARASNAPSSRPPAHRRISKPTSRLSNPCLPRQPSSRVSHAGAASLTNRQPASYASPRSPATSERLGTPRTPSRLPIPITQPHAPATLLPRPSQIPSPSPRSQSMASRRQAHSTTPVTATASASPSQTRTRGGSVHGKVEETSPRLDAAARHMVAKRMKQERQTDARINDFNARLMDMIRQGKEALGTTVEVDSFEDLGGGTGIDPWEDD
jgi:hypothetical protein